jgi:hypothetical protein
MSGLRQQLKDGISTAIAGTPIHASDYTKEADAAISAFRQWLADEGLVVMPRTLTREMIDACVTSDQLETVADRIDYHAKLHRHYAAMIAAAPNQPGEK